MKKISLLSAAFIGLTFGAMAADLPSRAAPRAPFAATAPIFTWTGLYAGVNAGYGWNTADTVTIGGITVDVEDEGGFVSGAQLGYNYQIGTFVVGLEGDLQWVDLGGDNSFSTDDWLGMVRGRAGVAFGHALVYATGGLAFAENANGWTAGGGIEYAFNNYLSAKVEGLYVNLDTDTSFGSYDTEFGVIRAGLNFKFGTY